MRKLKVDVRLAVRKIEITAKGLITSAMVGGYKSVFKGRGLEFDGYREYAPDDDAGLIDWKASKRANKTLVKTFVEERNLEVFFLIDVSSSMIFGSVEKLKIEYAAELIASLGYAILNAGDSLGFAFFSDKIIKKVPISRGKGQFYVLEKNLVDASAFGGGYNLTKALGFLPNFVKRFSPVIIVSDFIGLSKGWEKALSAVSKRYDIIAIMVRDPRDRFLIDVGEINVEDPFSDKQMIAVTGKIKDDYREYVALEERRIRRDFITNNCDFVSLSTDRPWLEPITELFRRRAKKFK